MADGRWLGADHLRRPPDPPGRRLRPPDVCLTVSGTSSPRPALDAHVDSASRIPERFKASRYFIIITYSVIALMLLPLIYAHGTSGSDVYWRYYFPSFIVASFFGACAFSGVRWVHPVRMRSRLKEDEV